MSANWHGTPPVLLSLRFPLAKPWAFVCVGNVLPFSLILILLQSFEPRPLIDTYSTSPEKLEEALIHIHKRSSAIMKAQGGGHLQLLMVILPERSGFYGELSSPSF